VRSAGSERTWPRPRRLPRWPDFSGLRQLRLLTALFRLPRVRPRLPRTRLPWPQSSRWLPILATGLAHPWSGLRRCRPRLVRPAALAAGLAWLIVGILLFTVYVHMSRTTPANSDGASNALQAWAMLHGNPLLRGWQLSDVSFYTTELPQYAALEAIRGLSPDVVHLAGAMTYTLLVLLAGMLAKGRATGREGVLRAGLAMGIMASPQYNDGVYVLVLSPDHAGTTVPVLLVWILLDRAPRRWWVPVLAGLLLTWALVADNIALIVGVAPLVAVGACRAYQVAVLRGRGLRAAWFEMLLVVMAIAAVAASGLIGKTLAARGGFIVWPVGNQLADLSLLPKNLLLTLQGILLLFGANFLGHNLGYVTALTAVHLAGIGLAGWAVCAALRRYGQAELAVQLTVTAIVISLAAYLFGRNALDLHSTREFTAVLPLGAALAGRLLARRLSEARMLPALALVLTGYLLAMGRVVALPPVPAQGTQLAAWLSAQHLYYGLGGYWQSNVITLETGGRVRIRSVLAAGPVIIANTWETEPSWYDPARHEANFIVLSQNRPDAQSFPWIANVRATFGQPASIHYLGQYTILVWNKNLLAELPR
jgi:hypothetical protein